METTAKPDAQPASSTPASSLTPLVLATSCAWLVFGVINTLAAGRPKVATLDFTIGLLSFSVLAFVRARPAHWRPALHVGAALSTLGMVLTSWWTGGWMGISWWLLAAVPLYVGHLASVRETLAWTAVSGLSVVVSGFPMFEQEFTVAPPQRGIGGVVLIVVSTVFVVAARRRYEAQLRETAARGRALAVASEERARAAEAKAALLATIGHEIRTPLHGVLGTAQVLSFSELARDQRELVDAIRTSGEALERIVNHTIDFARLEVGKLEIDPAPRDLAIDLEDLVDLFAASAAEQQLELAAILAPDLRVHADALRVRQIVGNLLGNAVKFTQRGHVLLRAEVDSLEGDERLVRIVVEDTGPGFPQDRIANLFAAFEQPDARLARLHGGSGLGLSISRDLSRLMGGDLVASNREEQGARFEVTLPLRRAELTRRAAPERDASALYIDPRPRVRQAATATSAAAGVTLHAASDVASAPQGLSPTLVLVALSHDYDIVEERRRAHARWPDARLVLLGSARALALTGAGAEAAGFHGTTLEPLRRSRLLAFFGAPSTRTISIPPDAAPLRVLVVDDDRLNREIVRRSLAHLGHDATLAVDGTDGLTKLLEASFDVALIDLHMPGLDGLGLARKAIEMLGGDTPRLIAFTASVTDADRHACEEAGFHDFLGKPLAEGALARALCRAESIPSGESSASPRAELAGVDAEELHRLVTLMGGLGETRLLVGEFVESARAHLAELQRHAVLKESVRSAHTLSSSARALGLQRVGELAKSLEMELAGLEEPQRQERVSVLGVELELGIRWLAQRVPGVQLDASTSRVVHVSVPERLDGSDVSRLLSQAEAGLPSDDAQLVLDVREVRDFTPDARDVFVSWFRDRRHRFARIALLMHERQPLRATVPLLGLAAGVPLRAFVDERAAAGWVSQEPPPGGPKSERPSDSAGP